MVRAGQWVGWSPTQLLGGDIAGRTLVIVGAGRIGEAVARRATGWRMRIIYVSRSRREDWESQFGAEQMELDAALGEADYVSLHVPLIEATRHLIDARRLGLMKKTAYLINTARGAVVDEQALITVLRNRAIAGAGLDVYEEEPSLCPGLAECDNTLLLPHLGSATHETRRRMSQLAASNLLKVLSGEKPDHAVNPQAIAGLR
jgi:glyoxylate reductase